MTNPRSPAPRKKTARAEPASKSADNRVATTLRLEPERLERLKIVAARRRVRVNELLLEGVDHVLALYEQKPKS